MYSNNKPKTVLMKKQRFVLTHTWCDACKRYGFKLIDAEGELSETGVFHSQEVGINAAAQFFIQKINSNSEMEMEHFNYYKLHIERIFEIYHEIFLLPLPLVDCVDKNFQEVLETSQQMITRVKNLVDIKTEYIVWLQNVESEIFFYVPEKIEAEETPWILLVITQENIKPDDFFKIFEKVRSKQQARELLEKALKEEAIGQDDYVLTLSKINNLENQNLPEQTPEEKLAELSKQN